MHLRFVLALALGAGLVFGCGESNSETGVQPTTGASTGSSSSTSETSTTASSSTGATTSSSATTGSGGSDTGTSSTSGGGSGVVTSTTASGGAAGNAGSAGAGTSGSAGTGGSGGTGGSAGAGGTGGAGGSGGTGSTDGGTCVPVAPPACNATPPDPGAARAWHGAAPSGTAQHRGRDEIYVDGSAQWLIARFAYGLLDSPLVGEDVDIYLLRGCGTTWEKLGTVTTTQNAEHAAVEGVDDNGGRIFFQIPADKTLGLGRHRVRFVVAGDLSTTELFVEHVPRGMPFFVSDMDGTLTVDENAEFTASLTGMLPAANADAAKALNLLASKGYRPLYLTARGEPRTERSRAFLAAEGFPAGLVRTSLSLLGLTGAEAATFKSNELAALLANGIRPTYAFGNTDTDAQAYQNDAIPNRFFFKFTDSQFNGRRIESYTDVLSEFGSVAPACP